MFTMNKFKEKIKYLLFPSTHLSANPNDCFISRKIIMLNTYFIIGMFSFFLFSFINAFANNNYFLTSIDVLAFGVFLYLYIDLKKNNDIKKASIMGLIMLMLFMFSFAYFNHNNSFGLIWTIFVPIFAISQFKPKIGLGISLVYYLFLFIFLLYGVFFWHETSWDLTSLLRLFMASMMLTFVYYAIEKSFQELSKKLKKLTNTDALTALFNRRKIDQIMESKFYEYGRYKTDLTIAMLDIDDFKILNDTYGHSVGDSALKEFSQLLLQGSRKTDLVGRWGGEEFMIIMPNTNLEQAMLHLQRLMQKLALYEFTQVKSLKCSIGVCQASEKMNTIDKLFQCADHALYNAKFNGKNQIST